MMRTADTTHRYAAATALGSGGLTLLSGATYGLLRAEAKWARHRIGDVVTDPPDPNGVYGALLPGHPLRLVVLGDSAAAGYGAPTPQQTFPAFMATGLSHVAHRPVILRSVAVVGAQSTDLAAQVPQALRMHPDVCVILIGANDVTHVVRRSVAVGALDEVIHALRSGPTLTPYGNGPAVVVGTCPDLGTVRPIAPPLRQVARYGSRRLATAQTKVAVGAGASTVSVGSLLGPEFAAAPGDMFGPDRFHPSPAGYKSCAQVMLPTVAAAVGVDLTEEEEPPELQHRVGALTLHQAATHAAASSGTEVSAAEHSTHGHHVPLVRLRRRRRHRIPTVGPVEPDHDTPSAHDVAENPCLRHTDEAGSR